MPSLPVVLVHGGGCGAWCWEPMLEYVTSDVLAVDLPPKEVRGGPGRHDNPPELRTLTIGDFAASVLADIDAAGYDRFVLVGHSMAGVTIPEIACRAPERVAHLVFVSCAVPPEGGTLLDSLMIEAPDVAETAAANIGAADEREMSDPGPQIDEARQIEMFCNDMDEAQTAFMLGHFGTEALPVMTEPVSRASAPAEIPKTWVRLLQDAILTVAIQDANIANLEATPGGSVEVIDLDCAHMAMITRPSELAEIFDRIAAVAS